MNPQSLRNRNSELDLLSITSNRHLQAGRKVEFGDLPETDVMNVAVLDKRIPVCHRVRVSACDPHATATDRVHNAVDNTRVETIHLDAVRSMSSNGQVVENHAINAAGCHSAVYRCVYRQSTQLNMADIDQREPSGIL